ncbi:hypothetical protein HK097_011056 [Rhizophlyctis rosea]|uniref:Uncharacterized protein n=1 Tax=Rhizophlyctis rosea TaxID=64517 RepID=A0AAD5X7V5_9FUNG|nr:hypothetical protein HK097_011056 [Rhizophlyctis rosea]
MASSLLPFSTRDTIPFRLKLPTKLIRYLALSSFLLFLYILHHTATSHLTRHQTIPINESYYDDRPPMEPVCLYVPDGEAEGSKGRKCVDTTKLKRLIMVPGHTLFVGKNWKGVAEEANWFLYPYQKGQLPTMLTHIAKGVQLAANDPTALVVFSGYLSVTDYDFCVQVY